MYALPRHGRARRGWVGPPFRDGSRRAFPSRERQADLSPVLVRHDPGCRWSRESDGGHSDAAKRISDAYNLHVTCGARLGQVFAFALADGCSDGVLYDSRADAVNHQRHNEARRGYARIGAGGMTVCAAAAVLRWQRQAAALAAPGRGEKSGGLEVIPRLTLEGQARQLAAMAGRINVPIALGRSDPR